MKQVIATLLAAAFLVTGAAAEEAAKTAAVSAKEPLPARKIFGNLPEPTDGKPQAIGFYTKGCLAGGVALPVDGPAWQAMRLSRNRNWGHPKLVALVRRLATEAKEKDGWPGLLVGDLAQPRGGPMLTGHASHQVGLDADIWLMPSPGRTLSREEREELSAVSVVKDRRQIDPKVWTEGHAKLLKRAASYAQVERIFVNPPIKKALCEWATGDRSWLGKIRPWYGHTYHFHIRMGCPDGDKCRSQPRPGAGDGCGELAYWLSDKPYAKRKGPPIKIKEMMMTDLPDRCKTVAGVE
jgi:penicillin-insensitive murein endopeptidase